MALMQRGTLVTVEAYGGRRKNLALAEFPFAFEFLYIILLSEKS